MTAEELRKELVNYVDTLKRNIDKVGRDVLKTKYQKPYQALCDNICDTATDYMKTLVFRGIMVKKESWKELQPKIQEFLDQSDIAKRASIAVFRHQDIQMMESICMEVHGQLQQFINTYHTAMNSAEV